MKAWEAELAACEDGEDMLDGSLWVYRPKRACRRKSKQILNILGWADDDPYIVSGDVEMVTTWLLPELKKLL